MNRMLKLKVTHAKDSTATQHCTVVSKRLVIVATQY